MSVKTDKLYLVGFMAAGKTTLARALGTRLTWRTEDIDELIEAREHRSIADIFGQQGEAYFRAIERDILLQLVPLRHAVVATGGGTFVDPDNRAMINRDGASIWLDVPLDRIVARLPPDGRRPLATDRKTLEQLYATRNAAYQHAHLRLDAGRSPVGELIERALDWLGY